jgi:hypothetical protein
MDAMMVAGEVASVSQHKAGALWQGVGKWPGFGAHAPFLFGSVMSLLALVLLLAWLPTARIGRPQTTETRT